MCTRFRYLYALLFIHVTRMRWVLNQIYSPVRFEILTVSLYSLCFSSGLILICTHKLFRKKVSTVMDMCISFRAECFWICSWRLLACCYTTDHHHATFAEAFLAQSFCNAQRACGGLRPTVWWVWQLSRKSVYSECVSIHSSLVQMVLKNKKSYLLN